MIDKALKEELRAEFQKVWGGDKRMIDYCVNKASQIVRLSGGQLYIIEKKKLDTHFPVGYSTCGQGIEYDEAVKYSNYTLKSTEPFRSQNIRDLEEMITDLQPTPADYCGCVRPDPYIRIAYCTGSPNIYSIAWVTDYQIRYEQWRFTNWEGFQALNDEDRQTLIDAYTSELQKRNKQIDAYIKRYGTSKFRAWTYWLDE